MGTASLNQRQVFCSEFSPDGRALATGSFDKSLYLWHAGELKVLWL